MQNSDDDKLIIMVIETIMMIMTMMRILILIKLLLMMLMLIHRLLPLGRGHRCVRTKVKRVV